MARGFADKKNSVTLPATVIRPILLVPRSVNQRAPSGPLAIRAGWLPATSGYSVIPAAAFESKALKITAMMNRYPVRRTRFREQTRGRTDLAGKTDGRTEAGANRPLADTTPPRNGLACCEKWTRNRQILEIACARTISEMPGRLHKNLGPFQNATPSPLLTHTNGAGLTGFLVCP